ncbi:MAG: phosphatidylglycerophosphatase A [Bdellovibrionia bacterium]
MKKWVQLFVTFGGLGRLPKAPGTWGSLGALALVIPLSSLGIFVYMGITVALLIGGILACEYYEAQTGNHDQGHIVIDEVVGILITMTWLPITWQSLLIGFVLFRVLDIWKPFPIGYLDRRVQGGLGVMIDDVFAGVIASIIMQILYTQTNLLGAQLVTISS